MTKTDWEAVAKLFALENERTGISVQDWCEQNGLNYQSARRYLKSRAQSVTTSKTSRTAAQSSTKKPKKNAQTAQKSVRKSNAQNNSAQSAQCANDNINADDGNCSLKNESVSKEDAKPKGRDEQGRFLKGEYKGNPNPVNLFKPRNDIAVKHGGYAKLLPAEDLEIGDESEIIGLIAERRMFRARLASALRTVIDLEAELAKEGGRDDPEQVATKLRLIRGANEAIDRAASRIESITKTLSSIRIDDINGPRLQADHKRIEAAEGKLLAETDKLGRKSTAESVIFQFDW